MGKSNKIQTESKTKKRSASLYLRELEPSRQDIDAYSKVAHGSGIHKYVSFLEASSHDEAEKRITSSFKNRYETMYGLFKHNRLIGVFVVHDGTFDGVKAAEVHYFIAEKFQRKGYCIKGIKLLSELLLDTYDFFNFAIHKENLPSICVQEKLGSVPQGCTKRYNYYRLETAA